MPSRRKPGSRPGCSSWTRGRAGRGGGAGSRAEAGAHHTALVSPSPTAAMELSPPQEGDMLLNHEAATAIDGLSRTQRERLIKQNLYPRPVRITTRRLGFVESEVRAWALARIAARDN